MSNLLCSSDFVYEAHNSSDSHSPIAEHLNTSPTGQFSDEFPREAIQLDDEGAEDPVLELLIASPPEPSIHSATSPSLLPALPPMPSPDRGGWEGLDHESLEKESSEGTYMCSRHDQHVSAFGSAQPAKKDIDQ